MNGYFVHFFAPPHLPRVPKNVVFVIDRSGSMNGIKMQQVGYLLGAKFCHMPLHRVHRKPGWHLQTREALQAILKDLHEEDHFALVVFDTQVSAWRKSLTKATKENILQATNYVKKIKDQGSKRKIMLLSNEKLFLIPPSNTSPPQKQPCLFLSFSHCFKCRSAACSEHAQKGKEGGQTSTEECRYDYHSDRWDAKPRWAASAWEIRKNKVLRQVLWHGCSSYIYDLTCLCVKESPT